jgi:hypothetical protein
MCPRLALMAVALALAGCSGAEGTPTPSPTPSGDPFEQPQGDPATGPVVAVGEGSAFEAGWRYAMYPTDDGWCAQIDLEPAVEARCDVLPADGEVLGTIGVRTLEGNGSTVVDVIATAEVATVWLVSGPAGRVPAVGMPPPDGVDGQAWVGVLPGDAPLTHVQAVAFNGQVLETVDLRE